MQQHATAKNAAQQNPTKTSRALPQSVIAPPPPQTPPSTAKSVAPKGPTQAALISPVADAAMIGGASILTYVLYYLFVDKNASTLTIAYAAAMLSFIVNGPHFMASYQLMYGDYRHLIFEKRSFMWAAIVAPALLIAVLMAAFILRSHALTSFMIQGMYLSVGWHYVKQTFGTAIVSSTAQRRFFSKWERTAILANLYCVWAMSWLNSNIDGAKGDLFGVGYLSLDLPEVCLTIAYVATVATLLGAIGLLVRKWMETGVAPSWAAMISFASIYIWFLPTLAHPSFFYLIPFFHSLQYMLFIVAMRVNHARKDAAAAGRSSSAAEREGRRVFVRSLVGFFGLAAALGWIAFNGAPEYLDAHMGLNDLAMGPTLWAFAFTWFINVHHYFIDNVIWRNDNAYVREHLVMASMERAQ